MSAETAIHKSNLLISFSFKWSRGEDYELRWLAHTLSVFSRRITRRILCVSLCWSNRASPVPLSFHSFASELNRKSFARLDERKEAIKGVSQFFLNVTRIGGEGHVQLEDYGLVLFIGLRHDLFCELDDGFKVGIMLILRLRQLSVVHCAG